MIAENNIRRVLDNLSTLRLFLFFMEDTLKQVQSKVVCLYVSVCVCVCIHYVFRPQLSSDATAAPSCGASKQTHRDEIDPRMLTR